MAEIRVMRFAVVLVLAFASVGSTRAVDWPKNDAVAEGSQSPDGRYGILIPAFNEESGGDPDDSPNYFADVKAHLVLGQIKDVDYFQQENHAGLNVEWSEDSSLCVADYEARFGFASIVVIQPHEKDFTQTEIGSHIQSALNAVIAKAAHLSEKEAGCEASAAFRINSDHKIVFRVAATTNPKELDDNHGYCAYFAGTYDPATAHWTVSAARSIEPAMFDPLSTALFTRDDGSTTYSDEQSEADAYDSNLNQAYTALRFLLPKAEFEKVKSAEIAWLKERDDAPTLAAKNLLVKARVKALQDMLW